MDDWSDWSEGEIDKLCTQLDEDKDNGPLISITKNKLCVQLDEDEDNEPLISITKNKRYLRMNLMRKSMMRIKNTRQMLKIVRKHHQKLRKSNELQNRRIKRKYKALTTLKRKVKRQESKIPRDRKSKSKARKNITKVCDELMDSFNIDDSCDETYRPDDNSTSDDGIEMQSPKLVKQSKVLKKKKRVQQIKKKVNDKVDQAKDIIRNKGWKRKGKNIKLKNRHSKLVFRYRSAFQNRKRPNSRDGRWNLRTPEHESNPIQRSPSSAQTATQIVLHYHTARLDNILNSNGLKRHSIYPDGNCFINAILFYLNQDERVTETVESLREKLTKHLSENMNNYIDYLTFQDNGEGGDKTDRYNQCVDDLRLNGHWNNDLADCMPLVIANIYGRAVRVFASRPQNPLYDVKPDLTPEEEQNMQKPILVAFFAIKGQEHYDGVEPIGSSEPAQTPNKQTPESNVTPRKRADYKSPTNKELFRKRQSKPDAWKRNVKKQKRQSGCEYVNEKGKTVPARTLKHVNCAKCKFRCSEHFSEEQRTLIFRTYWNLSSYEKQRNFICQNVQENPTVRVTTNRRCKSNAFYLPLKSQRVRVCKKFFLSTIDIGKKSVTYAMKKKQQGVFVGDDKRGKNTPKNKTPDASLDFIRTHIESFPTVASHYTRQHSARKYLNSNLTINTMYQLYREKCKKESKRATGFFVYRNIFCTEYNLGFHKPKKDQCSLCTIYDNAKQFGELTDEITEKYEEHQRLKRESRYAKEKDKARSQNDKTFVSLTFDLEAVLPCPCTLVGDLFYKRCLSCYNLSFYSLGDKKGTCFVWDETNGARGSCEIGTCILMNISSITDNDPNVKEITYYSDTCSGQNRNQFVASALLYAINQSDTLETINHKFLEKGHSEMESDSIHAAVEHAKKGANIYEPSQWDTIIAKARKQNPYLVIPLGYKDFYDLKSYSKTYCKNMKKGTKNEKVNWMKVKWIRVSKSNVTSIFVNYGFDDSNFIELAVADKPTRGRPQNIGKAKLQSLYCQKLFISEEKKKDLLSLCKSGIIPSKHHRFYDSLESNKKVIDTLSDSDVDEED